MGAEAIRRRISEIEESLARPAEEGRAWDRRRAQLERELDALRAARYATGSAAQ
jgi:hypothetical protein